MQNLATQSPVQYSGYSYYDIEEIATDNWDDFNKLLELQSDALNSRRTPFAKELKSKIEEKLEYLVESNWNEPLALQEMFAELDLKKTEFAINLKWVIENRLQELESECFQFPSTELIGKSNEMEIVDRQQKGLLLAVGYKTGLYGLLEEPRRIILDSVYLKQIPRNTGVKDIERWGDPKTGTRLKQIIYSLAWFTKQEKANPRGDYSTSICEREADLKYLKKKYYDNSKYDWKYPRT